MGIVKKKLSELPESTSLDGLIVLAVDGITNKSSKVGIGLLKGNRGDVGPIGPTGPIGPKGDKGDKGDRGLTGITPNITMSVNSLSPESAPTINKSGTAESPVFVIGIPKGKDGATPTFRTGTNGIEWKYSNEADTSFRSLVGYDVLKLKFTDLTASDIILLQKPATDKVQDLESWKQVAVSDIGNAISGANQARDSAIDVAEHPTYIGADHYVYQWNRVSKAYQKTAIYVRGVQGIQGVKGDRGDAGYTPVKGVDYFDGAQGPKGDKGDTGPIGLQGVQGIKGDTGSNKRVRINSSQTRI